MKTAFFFALSAAVHVAAFLYPIYFPESDRERILPLTIVTLSESAGASQSVARPRPARAVPVKLPESLTPHAAQVIPPVIKNRAPERPAAIKDIAPTIDAKETMAGALAASSRNRAAPPAIQAENSGDETTIKEWPEELYQRDKGPQEHQKDIRFTNARYNNTPKPKYPEAARRNGKEGRVILRVLVDEEGRSKTVEVNRSSGSEALDQAAAEAMKRWRFYPARLDDNPVQSWVRIPIDFLLEDGRD